MTDLFSSTFVKKKLKSLRSPRKNFCKGTHKNTWGGGALGQGYFDSAKNQGGIIFQKTFRRGGLTESNICVVVSVNPSVHIISLHLSFPYKCAQFLGLSLPASSRSIDFVQSMLLLYSPALQYSKPWPAVQRAGTGGLGDFCISVPHCMF